MNRKQMKNLDLSLYLVTDRGLARGRSLVDIVRSAVAGGVSCVQLREKECSTRSFIEEARALKSFLQPINIPLIINDRIDVALAAGADGVHLGQDDMAIDDARKLAADDSFIIGISAESLEDAIRAEWQGADYIGVSPVFSSQTKIDTASPLGLEGVKLLRSAVQIPIVGIGGINRENGGSVISAGADGLAVVSAIVSADDPADAARELKQISLQALKTR
jgi:thiamine-phosphate pyrophosphorylase